MHGGQPDALSHQMQHITTRIHWRPFSSMLKRISCQSYWSTRSQLVIQKHCLGAMTFRTTFHGNLSKTYWDNLVLNLVDCPTDWPTTDIARIFYCKLFNEHIYFPPNFSVKHKCYKFQMLPVWQGVVSSDAIEITKNKEPCRLCTLCLFIVNTATLKSNSLHEFFDRTQSTCGLDDPICKAAANLNLNIV